MTLDEYSKAKSRDTFTYWLEFGLPDLGSIRGGSSDKFGIYSRASHNGKEGKHGLVYGGNYVWGQSLGDSPERAFESVREGIVNVARAARRGDLVAVEKEQRLRSFVKWKVAFLYQDRARPAFPAIYGEDFLRKTAGVGPKASHLEAVQALMKDYDGSEDILAYCRRRWEQVEPDTWFYPNYEPGITADKWRELMNDPAIFTESAWKVIARIMDFGGMATCSQLANRFGGSAMFYNKNGSNLGYRIVEKLKIPTVRRSDGGIPGWPIAFQGRGVDRKRDGDVFGAFFWKLRPELMEALEGKDLTPYLVPEPTDQNAGQTDVKVDEKEIVKFDGEIQDGQAGREEYDDQAFLKDVWMSSEDLKHLKGLLKRKKNVILQGPPGVGKTYAARRLAWAMMGEKDNSRIRMVQFHQNYSYEDFVVGYKPGNNGFELREGVFYEFCQQAIKNPGRDWFFIIDEINRGNLSKILGELMMLIEADHRGESLTLPGVETPFVVPTNVYIIGMMNTADRSLAMIDYALRRRFSFFTMAPGFESTGFGSCVNAVREGLGSAPGQNGRFDELLEAVKCINADIENDPALGKGFLIGHSYLASVPMAETDGEVDEYRAAFEEWLFGVVNYDLLPLLEEYWYDDTEKLKDHATKLKALLSSHTEG